MEQEEIFGSDFGFAIRILKAGRKVTREGWNGKGVYLWLLPSINIPTEWIKDDKLLEVANGRDFVPCLGYIRMKTASGEVLTGWLASQSDMLAEDWMEVQ